MLKHQLWTYMDPVIEYYQSKPKSDKKKESSIVEIAEYEEPDELMMSDVLGNLYGTGQIDAENVSIHSAFICVLHLANEKGLLLQANDERDVKILKAQKSML